MRRGFHIGYSERMPVYGPLRHFAAMQYFGRFPTEAVIEPRLFVHGLVNIRLVSRSSCHS